MLGFRSRVEREGTHLVVEVLHVVGFVVLGERVRGLMLASVRIEGI